MKYSQKISRAVATTNETVSPEVIEASFDRLIIFKDKKGVIGQRIVSYIPDKAYLERHRGDISHNTIDKLDKDFSGYLRYADWDGTPLARLRIDKGVSRKMKQRSSSVSQNKSIRANTLSSSKDQQAGNPNNTLGEICYDVWEIEYSQTCYYTNPDDVIPTHCDPPVEVNRIWIDRICEDDGEYDPDDCSDPRNFENPDCQTSGGGGEEEEVPVLEANSESISSSTPLPQEDEEGTNKMSWQEVWNFGTATMAGYTVTGHNTVIFKTQFVPSYGEWRWLSATNSAVVTGGTRPTGMEIRTTGWNATLFDATDKAKVEISFALEYVRGGTTKTTQYLPTYKYFDKK